jgi:hypothetical protein
MWYNGPALALWPPMPAPQLLGQRAGQQQLLYIIEQAYHTEYQLVKDEIRQPDPPLRGQVANVTAAPRDDGAGVNARAWV